MDRIDSEFCRSVGGMCRTEEVPDFVFPIMGMALDVVAEAVCVEVDDVNVFTISIDA